MLRMPKLQIVYATQCLFKRANQSLLHCDQASKLHGMQLAAVFQPTKQPLMQNNTQICICKCYLLDFWTPATGTATYRRSLKCHAVRLWSGYQSMRPFVGCLAM
ncbi:TPA: hypothetical protein ACH3X2_001001 [Trebouxia sp. C0005]